MTDEQYAYERGIDEGWYDMKKDVSLFLEDVTAEMEATLKPTDSDCSKIHVLYETIYKLIGDGAQRQL